MLERYVHQVSVQDAGQEEPSATRERLKDRFPRGATRRMTQLGLLVGIALDEMDLRPDDTMVYASSYAETRALEAYLESFPSASPTLFQTSIHPSAVQQVLIGRQHPVGEFFPLTGRAHLLAQALQTAMIAPAPRAIVCGGEERGTWLLAQNVASDRSFAFALALDRDPTGAVARISLSADPSTEAAVDFGLTDFLEALIARRTINYLGTPGLRLTLSWL